MRRLHYRYPTPLVEGVLLRRYKRFLADVEMPGGDVLTVHCANPGAMSTCSTPGSRVRVRDAGNPQRKLSHNLEQIRSGRAWVCVNTAVPNLVIGAALAARAVPGLQGHGTLRREASDGAGSRLDFRIEDGTRRCWIEVKSVTLRRGTEAHFPDAVTVRGLRHLEALEALVAAGDRAVMLFLVGRADAHAFRPAWDIDRAYAAGLAQAARAGVQILPIRALVRREGVGLGPILPYHLGHG